MEPGNIRRLDVYKGGAGEGKREDGGRTGAGRRRRSESNVIPLDIALFLWYKCIKIINTLMTATKQSPGIYRWKAAAPSLYFS